MSKTISDFFLNQVVETMAKSRGVFGSVLCVESGDNSISWVGGAGNIQKDDRYFITSVTKLCVTAVLLRLRAEKCGLQLEDAISRYLPDHLIDGLHVMNGLDYTRDITVAHLMANTSGIPDYLRYKQANGKTADYNLNEGNDESWPFDKTLEIVKSQKPDFKPGQKGKVKYSNTNYRLLGAIIEKVTGKRICEVFQEYIFDELDLQNTYTYQDISDKTPVQMYYRSKPLHIPRCMASATAEGGIVSTAKETMIILKAFFNGHFFPKEDVEELKQWNFILFPFQLFFGIGLEKLWTPRVISPLKPISELMGFWGSSGAFAFYNTDTDLYFAGTANQSSGFGHRAAFNGMLKIIKSAL